MVFLFGNIMPEATAKLPPWEVIRQRDYGETGLTFLRLLHKNKKITL